MLKFNKNVIVSKQSNDVTLIYDKTPKTYYLYYQDKEIMQVKSKDRPKSLDDALFGKGIKQIDNLDDKELIKKFYIKIQDQINNESVTLSTLQTICSLLHSAENDEERLIEYVEKSNKAIQEKIMELSKSYGKDNETDGIIIDDNKNENAYKKFVKLLNIYDNDPIRLYDNKLNFYLANSENLFKMVINGLGANLKQVSRIIILNGGSKSGKSKLKSQLNKMMPIFEDIGRSSMAYVIGIEDSYYYDGLIVYGGDKGLTTEDQKNFEAIVGFFSELVTDNYVFRGTMPNNNRRECEFNTNGILYFITEPYTNLSTFKASDQVKSRTTYITVNPLTKQQSEKLIDNKYDENISADDEFEKLHQNYISYIIENPLTIQLTKGLEKTLLRKCKHDNRKHEYMLGLFISYCQYMQIKKPSGNHLKDFLNIFLDKYEVTDIEFMVYELLYRNLKTPTDKQFEKEFKNGWNAKTDMLNSRAERQTKTFFTAKQVKTYFKSEFRSNKHLKDIIDSIPEILNNLYSAELLERIETQSRQENIYYIPYNKELEPKEKQ